MAWSICQTKPSFCLSRQARARPGSSTSPNSECARHRSEERRGSSENTAPLLVNKDTDTRKRVIYTSQHRSRQSTRLHRARGGL